LITRAASGPATTGGAGFAAELVGTVVTDIATNLLPQSALTQLRAASPLGYAFDGNGVIKVPVHSPTPSGAFVAEANAIPVGALILTGLSLTPKKAAAITAITRELLNGSPGMSSWACARC
jgi:HK97 family phage major capsid protein